MKPNRPRHLFTSFVLSMMLAAGCQKEVIDTDIHPSYDIPIRITAEINSNTGAQTRVNKALLVEKFFLYGLLDGDATWYMDTYAGLYDGDWQIDQSPKWPISDKTMHFYGVSEDGKLSSVAPTINSNSQAELSYTVGVPADQKDLLVAHTDVSIPSLVVERSKASVGLKFNHALARLNVQAKNVDGTADYYVTEVALMNVMTEGTLNLQDVPQGDDSFAANSRAWTGQNTLGTYSVVLDKKLSKNPTSYTSLLSDANALHVLPQTVSVGAPSDVETQPTDGKCYLRVKVGKTQETAKYFYVALPANHGSNDQFTFAPGHEYTITLDMKKETIEAVARIGSRRFLSLANAITYAVNSSEGTNSAVNPIRIVSPDVNWSDFNTARDVAFYYTLECDLKVTTLLSNTFCGSLDGKGHTIELAVNSLNSTSNAATFGLFGAVWDGTVKNLVITGEVEVTYSGSQTQIFFGAVTGSLQFNSTIKNIANHAHLTITLPSSQTVTCSIGGIVGNVQEGEISNCVNTGTIWVRDPYAAEIGGISGCIDGYSPQISKCYSTGKMVVANETPRRSCYLGSISGYDYNNSSSIINCVGLGSAINRTNVLFNAIAYQAMASDFLASFYDSQLPQDDNIGTAIPLAEMISYPDYETFWQSLTYADWGRITDAMSDTPEDNPWVWAISGTSNKNMPRHWFDTTNNIKYWLDAQSLP